MKLVTISGLDGSGKSTQCELLANHFEKAGKKWLKLHAIDFSLANRIACFFSTKDEKPKAKTKAGKMTVFLRKLFLALDIFLFRFKYFSLKRSGLEFLLTDRYFFDQLVNVCYLEEKSWPFFQSSFWRKFIKKFLIFPDSSFLFRISPELILKRSPRLEQNLDYLVKKNAIYQKLAGQYNFIPLDGEKSEDKVFRDILNLL